MKYIKHTLYQYKQKTQNKKPNFDNKIYNEIYKKPKDMITTTVGRYDHRHHHRSTPLVLNLSKNPPI